MTTTNYGDGDTTYQALGGFAGISRLVNDFYDIMDNNLYYQTISVMHTESDSLKREKLLYFLCGWTGGLESYHQRFGRSISMPGAHAHLTIGTAERDQWLSCMEKALNQQNYHQELQQYMLTALSHPANMIVKISEKMQAMSAKKP